MRLIVLVFVVYYILVFCSVDGVGCVVEYVNFFFCNILVVLCFVLFNVFVDGEIVGDEVFSGIDVSCYVNGFFVGVDVCNFVVSVCGVLKRVLIFILVNDLRSGLLWDLL